MKSVQHYDPFDRSDGNGSRSAEEDWLDENTTAEENQWSTAETTFYYWEASAANQKKFQSLYKKHHGKGENDRKSTIRRSHIVSDAEMFVSVLEMPRSQRERVTNIAEELNFSTKRFGGKSYEKILLAVCSLVSDEALSRNINQEEVDGSIANRRLILTDEFRDLMEVNSLGSKEHSRIRQMLREKTNFF